jgi:hypothetical protein
LCVNTYGTRDGKIILDMGNGTSNRSAYTLASKFIFDRWNHVAITVNKTGGAARIYLNGTDVTSNSSVLPDFNSNQATRLGLMTNGGFPFKGNLDDTRIFARLLTPAEILALSNQTDLKSASTFTGAAIMVSASTEKIAPIVYPNPFNDFAVLKSAVKISSIEVYDIKGSKISEKRSIDAYEIPITDMLNGGNMHLLKVTLQDNEQYTLKVMKAK